MRAGAESFRELALWNWHDFRSLGLRRFRAAFSLRNRDLFSNDGDNAVKDVQIGIAHEAAFFEMHILECNCVLSFGLVVAYLRLDNSTLSIQLAVDVDIHVVLLLCFVGCQNIARGIEPVLGIPDSFVSSRRIGDGVTEVVNYLTLLRLQNCAVSRQQHLSV